MTRAKILIVDDKVENLIALEKILEAFEIEPIRATSGNQALQLTLAHDFAMALVDVQMPEMDGFEMVELLHQQKKTELLPVIFVSAVYSGDYYKLKGVEVGAIDFIEKPIIPELLRGKVNIFLQLHEYQQHQQQIRNRMQKDIQALSERLKNNQQLLEEETQKHSLSLEALDDAFEGLKETENLRRIVKKTTGGELRMAELKKEIERLNGELEKNSG